MLTGGRPLRRRVLAPAFAALALALGAPADAAPAVPLDIREGPMATALADLARQARIDLLYDRKLVRGLTSRPVRGRFNGEVALARLLAGSGIGYRTTPDGAYVLFVIPAPAAVEVGDGAIAELLVVGRRTQNVDIRRTENDIQPYRISGRRELDTSGRETVDEFLRARESANAQQGAAALGGGDPRSTVDLRGFGEASTLVLVDGRRMPFVPTLVGEFYQADINGIPLGAVERVEVLTTTAGGIYGPGAVGGVVNVVLRRDYRGADLTVQGGISDRGDAQNDRIEARLGFTPDHGKTDVMLYVSHAEAAPLRAGARDYLERADRRRFTNDPDAYAADLPVRNGVSVLALRPGETLSLDPAYGGAALNARYTFLPLGFSGTPADAGALLAANAGKLPLELADDASGRRRYIATSPTVTSGLFNARRKFGPHVEAFVDGLYARNRGRWVGTLGAPTLAQGATRPGNPFAQDILLTFPVGGAERIERDVALDVDRWTVGLIADLPRGWKATADYTASRLRYRQTEDSANTGAALADAVRTGAPGPDGSLTFAPFANWAAVAAALPALGFQDVTLYRLRERSGDSSVRLAGPVLTLPGGPLTVTLLGEDRHDRVADSASAGRIFPSRSQAVLSGYGEIRAPLGTPDADNPLLRGLELQLAVRYDRVTQRGAASPFSLTNDGRFLVRNDGVTYTAGARLLPSRHLMLRASVATGERPTTLSDLQTLEGVSTGGPADPRRGGRPIGSEGAYASYLQGSTRVRPAQAQSFTVGAVLNPEGRGRPRLSVDYSRIVVSDEPAPFPLSAAALLANEALYPDRVLRAPLTPADAAAGFTAGRVIGIDTTLANLGRTLVETVDAKFDWQLPTTGVGDVRLYGAATWQPTYRTRRAPTSPTIDRVGHIDGPLEWRGNAGVEWVTGPVSVDLNAQYYSHYRVTTADPARNSGNGQDVIFQGSEFVPAQVYVDLNIRRRFTLPADAGLLRVLDARLSVQNLFDHSPPIVAAVSSLGFSAYGDPRCRRLVATLSAQF